MQKIRIAVLASTRGTALQAIIDEIKAKRLKAELICVVSDKKNCYAIERAHAQGFKTYFVDPKEKSRVEFDRETVKILDGEKIDLIVLAGYMRIISPYLIGKFLKRIINIHPALIPKYCGKNFFGDKVHETVLQEKETESGITIHFVDENIDTGKIIFQKKCRVLPNDTIETLKERIQGLERKWYPKIIQQLADTMSLQAK